MTLSTEIYSVIASLIYSDEKDDKSVLSTSSFSTFSGLASSERYMKIASSAPPNGKSKPYDKRFDTWFHVLKLLTNVHNAKAFVLACRGTSHDCDFLTCPISVATKGVRYKHSKMASTLKEDLKNALTEFIKTHLLENDHPKTAAKFIDSIRSKPGKKFAASLMKV